MTFPGAQPIPPGYTYAGPRPPLDPTARKGARIAGMVGFALITIGWDLILAVLGLAIAGFLVVGILSMITDANITSQESFNNTFTGFDGPAWVTGFIIAALVGVVLWVAGILVSARILKSHGANRPWAITWAGFGIAVLISWFVDSVIGGVFAAVGSTISAATTTTNGADPGPAFWITGGLALVLGLVASVFIGWLSWLWMTIALRPKTLATA